MLENLPDGFPLCQTILGRFGGFVMVLRLPFTCILWVPTFQTYTSTLHCGNDMCTQCMTSLNLIKRAHLYNLCEFEMDQVFREDVRTTRHLFLVIWLEMV